MLFVQKAIVIGLFFRISKVLLANSWIGADKLDINQFPIADRVFKEKDRDHLLHGTGTTFRSFFILFLLVFLAYSNTFRAAWHLDDYPSIVENQKIQITDLTPQSLYQSLQHPEKETLWRPLAHLSFALNWFAGRDDVFGYHLVNVLIHLLSACVLYLDHLDSP